MGCLIGGIGNDSLYLWKFLCYIVIYFIKGYAVMDVAGSHHHLKHKTVLVASCMRLVGKLSLVISFCEQAAVRVGYAFGDHARLVFLTACQFLLGGVISAFFGQLWRLIIVIERLFAVRLPVCIDLLHQFLRIVLRGHWYRSLDLLLRVGVGFDMGAINEDRLGRQISCLRHLLQNPLKDLIYRFCGKPMTEIIAHRGKMRGFLLKRIPQKPAVSYV